MLRANIWLRGQASTFTEHERNGGNVRLNVKSWACNNQDMVGMTPGVLLIGVQERTSNNLPLFLEILNELCLIQWRSSAARVDLLAAL